MVHFLHSDRDNGGAAAFFHPSPERHLNLGFALFADTPAQPVNVIAIEVRRPGSHPAGASADGTSGRRGACRPVFRDISGKQTGGLYALHHGNAVGGVSASRNRRFESTSLQRRVARTSVLRCCFVLGHAFRGAGSEATTGPVVADRAAWVEEDRSLVHNGTVHRAE